MVNEAAWMLLGGQRAAEGVFSRPSSGRWSRRLLGALVAHLAEGRALRPHRFDPRMLDVLSRQVQDRPGGRRQERLGDSQRRIGLADRQDRKSTRLNSSHVATSYAVF